MSANASAVRSGHVGQAVLGRACTRFGVDDDEDLAPHAAVTGESCAFDDAFEVRHEFRRPARGDVVRQATVKQVHVRPEQARGVAGPEALELGQALRRAAGARGDFEVYARDARFYLIEVSLVDLPDPAMRERLMAVATSLELPAEQVDALRREAAPALRRSPAFQRLLRELEASE
jgi:hypothetical protein